MLRILLICVAHVLLVNVLAAQHLPIDAKASEETKNLYANLQRLSDQGVMFGHQDDLAYGVNWKYENGRSDVKEVVGDYPAVVGWDLGHLELKSTINLDSVPFANMRAYVRQVYGQGGLNTFSWHLKNPVDPAKSSWDKQDSTIQQLFADKKAMRKYKSWLNEVASFMKSLKGPNGEAIPVVFRPLHEHNGSWFWWGRDHASPEEYKQLYRFTVEYLRDKKKVHNLLYAYSPDKFKTKEEYLERYPGDDYVDLIGFDVYHRPNTADTVDTFVADTRRMVELLREIGKERNKVYAITETGLERISQPDWWTETLLPIIQNSGLSYVLLWRNGRPDHYYAPYPGQASASDFKSFYQNPGTLFGKEVKAANLYGPAAPATEAKAASGR
ncbi:glycoside hydrolase family 26 protein [Pontibacter akesuensis]|uniref:Mannan endo-1,4-beta-mannosidase n=1 Tax=Pontibacter akesuensis TaxID=388950 RepID=A0A1I7KY57_9BACT|nr:glycosyl hydrolase [Pontibacter akesuensis]GHA78452.1 mannan endo-1,4-beta-mannosidase [Pontibacter akesuensis]SFV02234.1 mannan endo-1,4-beta-mannosidase [Pontibacter akesuensis]